MNKTENDIDELLSKIKLATGLRQEDIAKRINYSRPYLSQAKQKEGSKLYNILTKEFQEELENLTSVKGKVDVPNAAKEISIKSTHKEEGVKADNTSMQVILQLTKNNGVLCEANYKLAKGNEELIQMAKSAMVNPSQEIQALKVSLDKLSQVVARLHRSSVQEAPTEQLQLGRRKNQNIKDKTS